MSLIERLQSLYVALAALGGVAVGLLTPAGQYAEHVVVPALLLMLMAVFLQIDLGHLRDARRARSVAVASLVLNFVFTPILAWLLGAVFLSDDPDLRIGLLLLLVTPCTDWYLVFTALARGHGGIAVALLPVNLVLQLALLPLYVLLLGGQSAMIEAGALLGAVAVALLIPLGAALVLRLMTRPRPALRRSITGTATVSVIPLLCLAVFAMFAWQAPTVARSGTQMLSLLAPLLVFFIVLPLVAMLVSRLLHLPGDQRVTLTMVTVARNSPVALAVAVVAFPDRPLIALALVAGPLIELPVLAVLAQVIRPRHHRHDLPWAHRHLG